VDQFIGVQIDYVERIVTHADEGDRRYISFNHAHYDAIKKGYETGEPFCIFEDDIAFDSRWKYLEEACNQLPKDWDLLYLGANITGMDTTNWQMPMKATANLFRLFNAWMTHAIVYSNKMARWVLDNFNPDEFPVYDEWLRVKAMPAREVYIINPMICYQVPGFSDVSLTNVSYGSHKEGNEWMKKQV
jgi:GR25 family glycosyltransferase involved in LPS biosynthesis